MMLLVQSHGEIGPGIGELPLGDFARLPVDDRDLADGGEVHKNPRAPLLQLKRFGMGAELEVLADALAGGGVEGADSSVAVAHVYAPAGRIVAQLIGVVGELDGGDRLVSVAIKNLAGAGSAVGDHNAVALGNVGHTLGFVQAAANGVNAGGPVDIHDFHVVVAINRGEYAPSLHVHSHVVEAALRSGQGNNAHQHQRLRFFVSGNLLGSSRKAQGHAEKEGEHAGLPTKR